MTTDTTTLVPPAESTTPTPAPTPTPSPQRRRFEATLTGGTPDRVPVTAWQHHIPAESDVEALADRVAADTARFGWDWIKINPRATYLPEAFGNTYDLARYTGVLPARTRTLVRTPADLDLVTDAADAAVLADHVRLVALLRERVGDLPLLPTVFSPLSVLLELTGTPSYVSALQPGDARPTEVLAGLLAERPTAVHAALRAITDTLVTYLGRTREAGADGVFFAVTGTAHRDVASPQQFSELSTPYDDEVLASVQGWRVVHTCGPWAHPEWLDRPGVHAVHWDQTAPGNPTLAEAGRTLRATGVGGVAHLAAGDGEVATVRDQARAALEGAGRAFLLAPSCSVPPSVPDDVYAALRDAVERERVTLDPAVKTR